MGKALTMYFSNSDLAKIKNKNLREGETLGQYLAHCAELEQRYNDRKEFAGKDVAELAWQLMEERQATAKMEAKYMEERQETAKMEARYMEERQAKAALLDELRALLGERK